MSMNNTMAVAWGDMDGDGDLDLYLLANRVFRPTLAQEIVGATTLPSRIQKTRAELLAPELTFEQGGRTFMAGQQSGDALADVLFGDVNPSGRLPVTLPNKDNELHFSSKIKLSDKGVVVQNKMDNLREKMYKA